MSDTHNPSPEGYTSSNKMQRSMYWLIALAIPLVFFVIVELGLRIVGIGAYPPLFIPTTNAPGFLQPNESAMQRFFAHPSQAPGVSIDTTYFASEKPPGTLRIVVQGGSSAAGFPYGKWASPAGMLKRRLRRSYPERDIEVISTAMSAVNSYALLDFADEIIDLSPDAVVIYAGHNEYLGVLGAGSAYSSSQSITLTRAILRLRRLHLYRTIESLVAGAKSAGESRSGTLMARIAGERRIPFESPMYHQGVEQYRSNMDALLARYRAAGIPVVMGTLVSNDLEQAPFIGAPAEDADAPPWQARYDEGLEALERGDAQAALATINAALTLDDTAADGWFALGRAQLALGQADEARRSFTAARDRDQLRFRAPTAINDVIRELSKKHNAMLADAASAIASQSESGIIGNDFILEHLHPNERGYFLLADAFFDVLVEHDLVGDPSRALDDETAWDERPLTQVDTTAAQYRLAVLLADWPFVAAKQQVRLPPPTTPIEQIAQAWYTNRLNWPDAMNRALVYYQQQKDWDNAARVAQNLAEAFHFLGNVQFIAGQLVARQGQHDLAVSYLERAVELEPVSDYRLALGRACAQAGRADDARAAVADIKQGDKNYAAAQRLLRRLQRQ